MNHFRATQILCSDESVSEKTIEIRRAHGACNTKDVCPSCNRLRTQPYRRVINGKIVEGCIDAAHTLQISGADLEWHQRESARAHRRGVFSRLVAVSS